MEERQIVNELNKMSRKKALTVEMENQQMEKEVEKRKMENKLKKRTNEMIKETNEINKMIQRKTVLDNKNNHSKNKEHSKKEVGQLISNFLKELNSKENKKRIHAIKRIKSVAGTIGCDNTRNSLLPLLEGTFNL